MSEEQSDDAAESLEQSFDGMTHAHVIPRLGPTEERRGWRAFWVGVTLVVLGVACLVLKAALRLPDHPVSSWVNGAVPNYGDIGFPTVGAALLLSATYVFTLAAQFTKKAATNFGERREELRSCWRAVYNDEQFHRNERFGPIKSKHGHGELGFQLRGGPVFTSDKVAVLVSGDFQPEAISTGRNGKTTQYRITEYFAYLDDEVKAARVSAARLAAALGGLTLISLQVFSQLIA